MIIIVYLYYDNGEIKVYDCSWILNESGVFEKIKDKEIFKDTCTIMNNTLAFDISGKRDTYNCIDICQTLYMKKVSHVKIYYQHKKWWNANI